MPAVTHRAPSAARPARRLAVFISSATRAGLQKEDIRELLMPLAVEATHPEAAPLLVRLPYDRQVTEIHVDTSRLPRDVRRPT